MTEAIELSLKDGTTWSGLSYESEIMPSTGKFSRLKGCYHSPDGTELVRFPGMALVAEPGYAEKVLGNLTTSGGFARFTGVSGSYGGRILMEESTIKARNVFLLNSGGPNTLLEGWYLTRVTNATNLVDTITAASAGDNVGDDDAAYVSRIQKRDAGNLLHVHDIRNVFGYCAIVFDANVFFSATHAAAPVDAPGFFHQQHGAIYVCNRLFDFAAPRQVWDWSYIPSVPLAELLGDVRTARDTDILYRNEVQLAPDGVLYALMPWYRRAQLESFDGQLIAAVPGYGCCFHWNEKVSLRMGAGNSPLGGWRGFLDALGIPKGIIQNLTFVDDGAGQIAADQFVAVQVCYFNSRTGRYGLVSEKRIVQAGGGANKRLDVTVLHPRWLMRETDADTIVVWGSAPAATVDEVLLTSRRYTVVSRTLTVATAVVTVQSYLPSVNDERPQQTVPTYLNQMPMGATIAVALKGHVMLAGQLHREASSDLSMLVLRARDNDETLKIVDPVNLCAHGLPTSYEGNVESQSTAMGVNVLQSVAGEGAAPVAPYYPLWRYRTGAIVSAVTGTFIGTIVKSHVQFTTKERPGECPAPQRFIADRLAGRDVIAAGRWGDTLVFCTEHETYGLSINQSPLGAEPTLLSSEYGAISPVMIQTDRGLEWLSHRGPVSFSIGVPVLHRQVEHLFRRGTFTETGTAREMPFLRDSRGLMMNHRAVHDRERRLVYHFLRRDQHNATFSTAGTDYKVQSYTPGTREIILEAGQLGPYVPIDTYLPCVIRRAGAVIFEGVARVSDYDALGPGVKLILQSAPATNPAGNDVFQCFIDAAQSKVGADTVLVHAYQSNSFALMEWSDDPLWQAAGESQFVDGLMRTVWITENKHAVATPTVPPVYEVELQGAVFGIDERYADRMQEPVVATATRPPVISAGAMFFEAGGVDFRTVLRGAFFTNGAIHYEAFIRSGMPNAKGVYELKWWGAVDREAGGGPDPTKHERLRLKLDSAKPMPTWVAGDVLEVGVVHLELETLKLNVPNLGDAQGQRKYGQGVRGLVLEYTLRRELNQQNRPVVAWAYAEGYGKEQWVRLHPETWGHALDPRTTVDRVLGGMSVGRETAIRLAIISNAQARLKDIRLDLVPGGPG